MQSWRSPAGLGQLRFQCRHLENLGILLRSLKTLMRNVEKKSAGMAAKVEQSRKALATAEQNRDAKEKALAKGRSHFH